MVEGAPHTAGRDQQINLCVYGVPPPHVYKGGGEQEAGLGGGARQGGILLQLGKGGNLLLLGVGIPP